MTEGSSSTVKWYSSYYRRACNSARTKGRTRTPSQSPAARLSADSDCRCWPTQVPTQAIAFEKLHNWKINEQHSKISNNHTTAAPSSWSLSCLRIKKTGRQDAHRHHQFEGFIFFDSIVFCGEIMNDDCYQRLAFDVVKRRLLPPSSVKWSCPFAGAGSYYWWCWSKKTVQQCFTLELQNIWVLVLTISTV